ncbi:hypothetical protein Hdeb2414_s0086g00783581 [Helianthus debilis subsp. tardiflorus]
METRNLEERCSGRGSHYGLQAHHLSYPLHQLTQETATGSKFYGMANGLFGKICDTFNVPFFNFLSRYILISFSNKSPYRKLDLLGSLY